MSNKLTPDIAARFAEIALGHVRQEYPHKLDHVMDGPEDVAGPRELHPIFYGSFDWHSCVHGYWLLLRVRRLFPDLPVSARIKALADEMLAVEKVAGELDYLDRAYSGGFERPYGWAWLLALHREAALQDRPDWAEALEPLAMAFAERFMSYLPRLTYPIRVGTHFNTAFAMILALEWAETWHPPLASLIRERAAVHYRDDRNCPGWEPGGDEFLTSALVEALCMKRVLAPEPFREWFDGFLPDLAAGEPPSLFTPATVSDRSDGKIAHLDGFNLTRAWCWRSLADALDPALAELARATADAHLEASLPYVAGDYMASIGLRLLPCSRSKRVELIALHNRSPPELSNIVRNEMSDQKTRARQTAGKQSLFKWGAGAAAVGGALAASAVYNQRRARRAEADNPPAGDFIEIEGVRLHYLERGQGAPIVLLHGNGAMIEDWVASGLLHRLSQTNRVIAFDRPGFGHSERPRSTVWTAEAQARLVAGALGELGIETPLVVGHSWGALVALALVLDNPGLASGLVLLGGYYYPSVRGDVLFASQPAIPGIGDAMRYTVSPLLGRAMSPAVAKKVFSPAPVPDKFENFPMDMALRPSQIRAEAAEAALMIPAAATLSKRIGELDLPVTIVAGAGDKMVDPEDQAERLHAALPGSKLLLVEGSGHMVHYTATEEVASAIREALPGGR